MYDVCTRYDVCMMCVWYTARWLAQVLVEREGTLPSEHNPTGTFTPVNLAQELKVQVGTRT